MKTLTVKKDELIRGTLCRGDKMCIVGHLLNKKYGVEKWILRKGKSPDDLAKFLEVETVDQMVADGLLRTSSYDDGPLMNTDETMNLLSANDTTKKGRFDMIRECLKSGFGLTLRLV